MSKGHVNQLRALREAKFSRSVTKPTKAILAEDMPPTIKTHRNFVTKIERPVTKIPAPVKPGRGRPKVHASAADRQRACRSRKAQSHVKA